MTPIVIIAATALLAAADGKTIIDMIQLCKATDPDLNECVKASANVLIPHIAKGADDFGIPTMDPLFTPQLEVVEETNYVNIDLKYTDVNQYGLSKMTVDDAKIDLEKGVWDFRITQPVFSMVGKYKSTGTILKVGINGEGNFNTTHLDTKVNLVMEVSREKKGDVEYFKLEKFNIYYVFGTALMDYEGLYHDDPEMAKSTNEFLNDNSHEILTDLKPALEDIFSKLFRGYMESFLGNIPADKLFPPN